MKYFFTLFIFIFSFLIKGYSISHLTSNEIDSMLQITRYDTTQNKTKTFIYYRLFYNYLEKGDIDSGFVFYPSLLHNLNKLKNKDIDAYASFCDNMAWAFLMRNMPDSSLSIMKRFENTITNKNLSNKYIATIYFGYGLIYWYTKDYPNSLKYFFKVKTILNKNDKDKTSYVLSLNYISDNFMQLGDFGSAAQYLKKAIVYSTANELTKVKAYTLRNLGLYYFRIHDYKNAEKYLLKSTKEFENANNDFNKIFLNYNYLIDLYLEIGNLEKASNYLNTLITITVDTMPENFKAGFYKNMGKYFLERGVPQKAVMYFKKYIDNFDQYYYRDYNIYKYLGESYYLLNQIKLGFYFYKKSFDIMDSTYTTKLKFSSDVYKNISQGNITTTNNNTNNNISDIISFKELGNYYLKSYKYYIISGITLIIILILFLIYKSLDYSRKYFVERNTVKKYHKKIKTLERSLAELDEFIEERSNMLQEEVDNNKKLKDKLKKIETELNFTLKELHHLKLEYTRTIKGPLSKLINYLDVLMQKHYTNLNDNDIILEKTIGLIKRLKYLILFRYGNKNFTVKDLSYNLVNIKDLLNLVLNILSDISIDIEYSVKENYIGNNFLVKTNEKVLGNIIYSLFHYFLEETGKINSIVDLYEEEKKILLTLGFYGKTFTDAEVSFISSEEIMTGITNIKERTRKNTYYKLIEIFYLLKKLEYDISFSYKENYFAITINLFKEINTNNIVDNNNRKKLEINGNILILGIDEEEKILYEKILEEKSSNKNYKIYWLPNVLENGETELKKYNEKGIFFNLVIIKIKLLKNSTKKYKDFIHNLRKINKSFLDVNIVAIIEEYDEEKFMELENYFSSVLYTPFDTTTFTNVLIANLKNNKPNTST